MGLWDTIRDVGGAVSAVAGVFDIFSDDGPQGPNPNVATFSWLQQRVNAAEQVRQLGWQAWMAGQMAHQHVAAAAIANKESADLTSAAEVQDRLVGYHASVSGHQEAVAAVQDLVAGHHTAVGVHQRAEGAHQRSVGAHQRSVGVFQGDEARRRAAAAVTRGELLTGDLERRYTGTQATYDRAAANAAADKDSARINAKAASAAAAATITRAQVAIERATTRARQSTAGLRLQAAQGGLRSSSFTESGTSAIQEDLALTVREQNATIAGARARASAALAQAGVVDRRAEAALDFASAQHGIGMGQAAADYTRGQLQVDDLSAQAQQWGLQAAQSGLQADASDLAAGRSDLAAGRSDIASQQAGVQAAGTRLDATRSDIASQQAGVQAGATRTAAEAAGLRASGSILAAQGAQIQQDFFRTQAELGTYFLQQQPGVEEYGGQEDILQRMSTRHDTQEDRV